MNTILSLFNILAVAQLKLGDTPGESTANARLFFFVFLILIVVLIVVVARVIKKR